MIPLIKRIIVLLLVLLIPVGTGSTNFLIGIGEARVSDEERLRKEYGGLSVEYIESIVLLSESGNPTCIDWVINTYRITSPDSFLVHITHYCPDSLVTVIDKEGLEYYRSHKDMKYHRLLSLSKAFRGFRRETAGQRMVLLDFTTTETPVYRVPGQITNASY